MPWEGDEFVYTEGSISHFVKTFLELRELAMLDPESQSACTYYDICRTLIDLRMKPRQWEIFRLRLSGYTYREIGDELGFTHVTAWNRMQNIEGELRARLCEGG